MVAQSLLQHSPFRSFPIPGIILFSAIGVLSCWVLWTTLQRQPGYGWSAAWPHYFYGAVALLLILSGMILVREPVAG
jgi:peptidoglycan biosynthesis protein MviN/MurJ (putative lipid II flippase)